MAGKTKVNLEFEMSNASKQTVSFEVPNGVDGAAGTNGKDGAAGKDGAKGADGVGVKTVTVTSSQIA
ncbi:MAG: hypothetical protein [Caudoviricetes sp.]|nr:MAG: hypothetical protein [Caudoviricetes sp.]